MNSIFCMVLLGFYKGMKLKFKLPVQIILKSVSLFLKKVECLRESREISKEEQLCAAGDFFNGPAWSWFLNNRQEFKIGTS